MPLCQFTFKLSRFNTTLLLVADFLSREHFASAVAEKMYIPWMQLLGHIDLLVVFTIFWTDFFFLNCFSEHIVSRQKTAE